MELLKTYDDHNDATGELVDRNIVHTKGLWHHEILVIVINEKNEILLQKRSWKRKYYPGKWALCAGHVIEREREYTAAIRELEEELGLKVKKEDLNFIGIHKKNDPTNKKFSYIYVVRTDMKIEDYIIQKEELSAVKYIPINKLIRLTKLNDKSFAFHGDKFHIDLFVNIKKNII